MNTESFFEAAWAILVECAGARGGGSADFCHYMAEDPNRDYVEWRFQGSLGSGGKLKCLNYGKPRWYVTAYPEDIAWKPSMQVTIDVTNARLAALCAEHAPKSQAEA